jgi:hypothetical protein
MFGLHLSLYVIRKRKQSCTDAQWKAEQASNRQTRPSLCVSFFFLVEAGAGRENYDPAYLPSQLMIVQ